MKKLFRRIGRSIRYAWAWFWQLCETCKHIDDPEGEHCAECRICMAGKPRWVYRGGNVKNEHK